MNSNAKQFESKPITISPDGQILRNGIARVTPKKDPETGLPTFQVYDPNEKSLYRTCFLHVELFRLFSGIEAIPRLDPEDVEFVEGERMHVNNLQLTERGRKKVYGSREPGEGETGSEGDGEIDAESSGDDPDESVTDPSQDEDEGVDDGEPASDSDESESVSSEEESEDESSDDSEDEIDTGTSETLAPDDSDDSEDTSPQPSPEGEGVDESSDDDSDTVFAVKGNGSFYLLEDADGNDLLPTYNDGSQINGRKNVLAIAEEYGLDVEFKE